MQEVYGGGAMAAIDASASDVDAAIGLERHMDHAIDMRDLADRFFAAITAADIDTVRAIYAPDAVIWHSHTNAEQSAFDNLRTLSWIGRNVKDFRYEDRRCEATESGFVEQHVVRGTAPSGEEFSISACIVCTVMDGRITRLSEYFDSAAAAALLAG
jgi:ketosteroid isomerase-like protein